MLRRRRFGCSKCQQARDNAKSAARNLVAGDLSTAATDARSFVSNTKQAVTIKAGRVVASFSGSRK